LQIIFTAIDEAQAGPKWQRMFERYWPSYQRWFWSEGDRARPTYLTCLRALRDHMPELLPTYSNLVDLAGGGDQAARFLSMYCPPPFLTGCSQAVWTHDPPLLIRNYDYSPSRWEAVSLKTAWGHRPIIAMGDCMWGVLDGMNADGLALSLSFGGRAAVGEGFGIPLVLRYILECCSTIKEAVGVLQRVPVHMTYSVTVVDRWGDFATVYLAPDRPAKVLPQAVVTNHQHQVEWQQHALATRTIERERFLTNVLRESAADATRLVQAFLRPPTYVTAFEHGFGTLYTAVYHPATGEVEHVWPNLRRRQSFTCFTEGELTIQFPDAGSIG
jgi:predicted choloylglycine hydrolase